MTVKELIEELLNHNPDSPVYIHNGDDEVPIDEVEIDNYFGYTRRVIIK